jgi:hypothetical protein
MACEEGSRPAERERDGRKNLQQMLRAETAVVEARASGPLMVAPNEAA